MKVNFGQSWVMKVAKSRKYGKDVQEISNRTPIFWNCVLHFATMPVKKNNRERVDETWSSRTSRSSAEGLPEPDTGSIFNG